MRSNQRLIAMYLLAMMLVNFYGGLTLRTKNLTREKERRLGPIGWFFKFILRNLWVALLKMVLVYAALFIGAIIWVVGWIISQAGWDGMKNAGEEVLGWAAFEYDDTKRVVESEDAFFSMAWFHSKRSLVSRRVLTQGGMVPVASEITVNCDDYKQTTPQEVQAATSQETFKENLVIKKKSIIVNRNEFFLRRGFQVAGTPLTDADRKRLDEEANKLSVEIVAAKSVLFKSRIKRGICVGVRAFNIKLDQEINPEKWTGDKKKTFDDLMADYKGSEAKKKAIAEKKLAEMTDKYKPGNKDFETHTSKMLIHELKDYGIVQADLQSQYGNKILNIALTEYNKQRMATTKTDSRLKGKELSGASTIEASITNVSSMKLKDDTGLASLNDNEDEGEQNEDGAGKQTKEQL